MPFYVYILECGDGSYYTGQTDDLELRLIQHEEGEVPGYVKKHMRFELAWFQEFVTRDEAFGRERQIKGWTRRKKLALIEQDWERLKLFSKGRERSGRKTGPSAPPLRGSAQGARFSATLTAPCRRLSSAAASRRCFRLRDYADFVTPCP